MKRFSPFQSIQFFVVLILLGSLISQASAADAKVTYYAAIAYSARTKKWGYSEKCTDKEEAFKRARKNCSAGDAKVIVWSANGTYCALAQSPKKDFRLKAKRCQTD
ncbi:MAG TPA: DUF4189 domain-containing protein [Prosthecobacter sp.]|nr:DUF4189 domain-containing protein [Prosthecobacter sp.]